MKSAIALTIAALATLGIAGSASAAAPGFYSGNFPLTVTHSRSNGAGNLDGGYCLTLTDNGTLGWPHSGPASLASPRVGGVLTGTFQLIDRTLLVAIEAPGGTGVLDSFVIAAPAGSGIIGQGAFARVYGVADITAVVEFGKKGGC